MGKNIAYFNITLLQKMKIKTKLYLWLWLLCTLPVTLQAQEVISTSGGYGETSGAKVTWTIGEPVTETIAGTNSILNQGFNQGDLIITMIKNLEEAGLTIKIYPNPAHDQLRVSVEDLEIDNLRYVLVDMGGKVLSERKLSGAETNISVNELARSSYILKVYQNFKEIGVFIIIKK
jgi:hypothetical protein